MNDSVIDINLSEQTLAWIESGRVQIRYRVSTAKNGAGEQRGSGCTPRGWHSIRAKIGDGLPINTVFVARRPTGEIYSTQLAEQFPQRDWILSRILWLGGLERGINRHGDVDTTWRYIYIHGTPDELINGHAGSHGCIRMRNDEVIDLFNRIALNTRVYLHE